MAIPVYSGTLQELLEEHLPEEGLITAKYTEGELRYILLYSSCLPNTTIAWVKLMSLQAVKITEEGDATHRLYVSQEQQCYSLEKRMVWLGAVTDKSREIPETALALLTGGAKAMLRKESEYLTTAGNCISWVDTICENSTNEKYQYLQVY